MKGHAQGRRNLASPAVAAWADGLRLMGALATADARRGASWLSAVGPAMALLLVYDLPSEVVFPLAWANGVLAAVLATGHVPRATGRIGGPGQDHRITLAWSQERAVWPCLGFAVLGILGGGAAVGPCGAGVAGVAVSVVVLAGCRRLGCSTADAVSGTLALTVLAMVVAFDGPGPSSPIAGVLRFVVAWAVLAMALLATSAQVDRAAWLAREVTSGGGPLGFSELRRWYFRLMMAVVLIGMVRWLFASEPRVGLYGLAGGLLAASFVLPEVLLSPAGASAGCWLHVAWAEGGTRSTWRRVQRSLLAAVVTGWPLMIALVLVPATRGVEALLAVAAIVAVVLVAAVMHTAVGRRLLAGDTAFAMAALSVWCVTLVGVRILAAAPLAVM